MKSLSDAKRTAKSENPFVSDSKIPARAAQNTSGIKVCIHQTPVVQWQILEINSQNELLHTLSPEHTKKLVVSFLLQATLCYRGSSCEECKKDPKRTSVRQKVSQHSWSHDLTTGLLRTLGSSHISAFDFFVTSFFAIFPVPRLHIAHLKDPSTWKPQIFALWQFDSGLSAKVWKNSANILPSCRTLLHIFLRMQSLIKPTPTAISFCLSNVFPLSFPGLAERMQNWPRIWKVWAVSASVNPSSDVATAASGQTMSSTSKGKFNTSFLTDLWFDSRIDTSLRFLPIQEQEKWIIWVYWPMPSLMLPASCALPGMQSASVVAVERTSFNPHLFANTCSLYPKCSCTLMIWMLNAACLSRQCNCTRQSESTTQPTKMWGDLLRRISPGTRWSPSCLKHAWDTSVKQKKKQSLSKSTTFEIIAHHVFAKQKTPKHLSSFEWLWHYPLCLHT